MLSRWPVPGDRVLISENATKYVVRGMKKYLGTIVTVQSVSGDDFIDREGKYTWSISDAIETIIDDNPVETPSESETRDFLGF